MKRQRAGQQGARRRTATALSRPAAAILLAASLTACAAGSPGSPAGGATGSTAPPTGGAATPTHTPADVEFMVGMIAHHRQALEMTALVPTRSRSNAIRLLAERIEVSQTDEIAQMSGWLERRGASVPAAEGHAHGHTPGEVMPGMLSQEEMARLAAATGAAFDRLFLELMIQHHEGALVMVQELMATPGAGQESQIFQLAHEVDADQAIEIRRMRQILATLP